MMRLLSNGERYDWQTWLVGILRSFISGAAGAVVGVLGPMATDSGDFNFTSNAGLHHTLISMTIGFFISGLIHMAMFLQTHGAPDLVTVKATEETVTKISPKETHTMTVETTTVAEVPKETKP